MVIPDIGNISGERPGFHDGLAAVRNRGSYGYIDAKGSLKIPARYDDADGFSEGLAPVRLGSKWGYIDKLGGLVIEPRFDLVRKFSEGKAAVKLHDRWGYVDKSGTWIIEPKFHSAETYVHGVASVDISNEEWAILDEHGKCIWRGTLADMVSRAPEGAQTKGNVDQGCQ
jgi:hypothetical protein